MMRHPYSTTKLPKKEGNNFPNPDKEEKIMTNTLKFFTNCIEDQKNPRSRNEDTIQEFLQLLKEKQSIGRIKGIQRWSKIDQG